VLRIHQLLPTKPWRKGNRCNRIKHRHASRDENKQIKEKRGLGSNHARCSIGIIHVFNPQQYISVHLPSSTGFSCRGGLTRAVKYYLRHKGKDASKRAQLALDECSLDASVVAPWPSRPSFKSFARNATPQPLIGDLRVHLYAAVLCLLLLWERRQAFVEALATDSVPELQRVIPAD
jgi:hypothetical protein